MRIIVLFNLKPSADAHAYEDWARTRDLPGVRTLPSVRDFTILRAKGLLFSGDKPPFDYIEIIDVADLEEFKSDCGGEGVQALAKEMGAFTDGATFIVTEALPEIV